ncbi:MAG: pilus assembly protein TadG-related protein [Caulobacteraceae bacterium]
MPLPFLRRFSRDKRGSIAMIGAVALPAMIGFASLVAEYGHGLLVQAETQRTADAAAYAGALAYSTSPTTAAMTSAANAVANLNGIATSAVTASLVPSSTGDGNSAVQVLISSNVPLLLAPLLGGSGNLPVKATSLAELKPNGSPCIQALSATGAGVTLAGGAVVNTSSCSIASNAAVATPCGTTLTTKIISYNSATAPSSCSGASIKPPTGTAAVSMIKKATTDPLASNVAVTGAVAALAFVSAESAPAAPAAAPTNLIGGGDIYFGNTVLTTLTTIAQALADGCVAAPPVLSSTWTLTCTGLVPFSFGNITVASGQTVNFNLTPLLPAAAVYYFSGSITTGGGSTLNFGPRRLQHRQGPDQRRDGGQFRGRNLRHRRGDGLVQRRGLLQHLQYRHDHDVWRPEQLPAARWGL